MGLRRFQRTQPVACASASRPKTLLLFWPIFDSNPVKKTVICVMPVFHECQRCTACCRWPGQVRVTHAEISRLAAHKGLSEDEFIQRYLRLRPDRQGLVLQEKPNAECIFLEGNDCSVQAVKPQQCRDFPNLWNFPGFEKICHAKARIVSSEEYWQLVAKATGRAPEEIRTHFLNRQ
jgi:Fe-S-cluster containining protein